MTGDGINDAPSFESGFRYRYWGGNNVAIETADIILVRSNPLDVESLKAFKSNLSKDDPKPDLGDSL